MGNSGAATKKRAATSVLRDIFVFALFAAYLFTLAWLLLLPSVFRPAALRPPPDARAAAAFESRLPPRVNLAPFKTIRHYMQSPSRAGLVNNAGNVIVFAPLGFFLRRFSRGRAPAFFCVLAPALASLLFESLQLLWRVGSFDVDDIILNALGSAAGYIACALLARGARARQASRMGRPAQPARVAHRPSAQATQALRAGREAPAARALYLDKPRQRRNGADI
ncbi:MAG: VanZ family protein [Clostridiales bacterium]|nr:VanZ family protein [Clostridiales bacterium]